MRYGEMEDGHPLGIHGNVQPDTLRLSCLRRVRIWCSWLGRGRDGSDNTRIRYELGRPNPEGVRPTTVQSYFHRNAFVSTYMSQHVRVRAQLVDTATRSLSLAATLESRQMVKKV